MANLDDNIKNICDKYSKKIYDAIPKEYIVKKETPFNGAFYTTENINDSLLINFIGYEKEDDIKIDLTKVIETYKSLKNIFDEIEKEKDKLKLTKEQKNSFDIYTEKYRSYDFIKNIEWIIQYGSGKRMNEFLKELEKDGYLKKYLRSNDNFNYYDNNSIPNFLKNNTDVKNIYKDYGIASKIKIDGKDYSDSNKKSEIETKKYNSFVLENIDKNDKESIEKLKSSKETINELMKDEKNKGKLKELLQGIKLDSSNLDKFGGLFYDLDFLIKLNNIVNGDDDVLKLFENREKMLDYISYYYVTFSEGQKYLGLKPIEIMKQQKFKFDLNNIETIKEMNRKEFINSFKDNKKLALEFSSFVSSNPKCFGEFFIKIEKGQNKDIYKLNKDFYDFTQEFSLEEVRNYFKNYSFDEYVEEKMKKEDNINAFQNILEELIKIKNKEKKSLSIEKIIEKSIINGKEKDVKNENNNIVNKATIIKKIVFEDYLKAGVSVFNFNINEIEVMLNNLSYVDLKKVFVINEDVRSTLERFIDYKNTERDFRVSEKFNGLIRGFAIELINEYGNTKGLLSESKGYDILAEFDIELKDLKNEDIMVEDLNEKLMKELLSGLTIGQINNLIGKKEMLASNQKNPIK
jgi:hypothetical protein